VGWNVDALLREIEQAGERVLAHINGTPKVGQLPRATGPNFLAGNANHAKADWHFTTANARIKLKQLYPSI
jgi:hypothetical protein